MEQENLCNTKENFDCYGFLNASDNCDYSDYSSCLYIRNCSEDQKQAWLNILDDWDSCKTKLTKLQTFIQLGVPNNLRPRLWKRLLDIEAFKSSSRFQYKVELEAVREQFVDIGISEFSPRDALNHLAQIEADEGYKIKSGEISIDAIRHIFLDLDRSYPTHRMFMSNRGEGKEGRAALCRILAVYSRYNAAVEYCQGMSLVAGLFLIVMGSEETAFWCLVSVMERGKYLLGYYDSHMERIQKHSCVFEKLFSELLPELYNHLLKLGIVPIMFLVPWFLSVYTCLPCWDSILAIWDTLLLEGNKTIFRVAMAVLQILQPTLMQEHDISTLLPKLLHVSPEQARFEVLMPTVWNINVDSWEIDMLLALLEQERLEPQTNLLMRDVEQDGNSCSANTAESEKFSSKFNPANRSKLLQKLVNLLNPHMTHGMTPINIGSNNADSSLLTEEPPEDSVTPDDDFLTSLPYVRSPNAHLAHVQATAFTLRFQHPWPFSSNSDSDASYSEERTFKLFSTPTYEKLKKRRLFGSPARRKEVELDNFAKTLNSSE